MPARSRFISYGIPLAVIAAAVVSGIAITSNRPSSPVVEPLRLPPQQPASSTARAFVGATGVVEAAGRNVSIGAPVAGVVTALGVTPGQEVVQGTPLFTVDARELRSQVTVREADLAAARRGVEVTIASVAEARANLADRIAQSDRARAVDDPRAISGEEIAQRRFAADAAAAQLARAQAQARQAQAAVGQAQALLAEAHTALARPVVRAPLSGTVLQVNVRPGQYAPAGELQSALIVMGRTHPLNLRVDVDEVDVPRLLPGARGSFSVRGDGSRRWSAEFVRIEPLLVGKTNLSGASGERVDTRVLQVLYAFDPAAVPAFVGQQVDVFLPARAAPTAAPREVVR